MDNVQKTEPVRIMLEVVKMLLVGGGPIAAILSTFFGEGDVERYMRVATAVVGIASTLYGAWWMIKSARDSSILSAASQVPGVDFRGGQIQVDTSVASTSAVKAAMSNKPAYAGVVPAMGPSPMQPPSIQ